MSRISAFPFVLSIVSAILISLKLSSIVLLFSLFEQISREEKASFSTFGLRCYSNFLFFLATTPYIVADRNPTDSSSTHFAFYQPREPYYTLASHRRGNSWKYSIFSSPLPVLLLLPLRVSMFRFVFTRTRTNLTRIIESYARGVPSPLVRSKLHDGHYWKDCEWRDPPVTAGIILKMGNAITRVGNKARISR